MPKGYMGLIQTKGSLARLFVMVQCSDAQVDPGYEGHLTFEICNLGDFVVNIKRGSKVAQLFLLKCSTRDIDGYNGRYQGATGPTVPRATRRA
jgi:deoxycytidine triphosphate deaminase